MAHAWVEVYFNGFGWMSFDPTPLYQGFEYLPVSNSIYNVPDDPVMQNNQIVKQAEKERVPTSQTNLGIFKNNPLYWLLIPIFVCIIAIIAVHLRAYIFVKRLSKTGIILYYNSWIVNILKHMGIQIEEGETMREFCIRTSKIYGLNDIIKIYEDALYGKKIPSSGDIKSMRLKYEDALRLYRDRIGKLPYLAARTFDVI
jgi:hypothetical protein